MQYQRATIFGASGFIGRYVVKRLATRGTVIAAVSRHASSAGYLRPMGDVGQIALIDASLDDEATLAASLVGAEAAVCAVGILFERGRQRFEAVHHLGAARVARLAKAAGVKRFVHISAIGADPAAPSLYARTKGAGEAAVRDAFPEATILRPSLVFGPEDDFFNRFAEMARFLPALPLIGGGHTRFQPVFAGDVGEAIALAVDGEAKPGAIYELGGPDIKSFKELMEFMLATIERRRLLLPVPFAAMKLQAMVLQFAPNPPLTPDQVELLKTDNVVAAAARDEGRTLEALGIVPNSMAALVPGYLWRFRKTGQFTGRTA